MNVTFFELARDAAQVAVSQAPQGGIALALQQVVPFLLLFAIIYFMLLRPQAKQRRELENMLAALKSGDEVITAGGLVGTIVEVKGDELKLEIAPKVNVKVMKQNVTALYRPGPIPMPTPKA